jgi:hypothetical protein
MPEDDGVVASSSGTTIKLNLPQTEEPSERIGHYKLLQAIGEGGRGVVYSEQWREPGRFESRLS